MTIEDETSYDRARRVVRAAAMSQREFADRIGLDQTALSKGLRGTRRLTSEELRAIARVGRVPVRYLEHGGRVPDRLTRAESQTRRSRAEAVRPDIRRAQILEATAQLIARKGSHRVRIADIARACGTSAGTLLYHFESKDEALEAALSYYAERLHVRLDSEFGGITDPAEKLRRLIEVQLPLSEEDLDEWSVWVQSWTRAIFEPTLRDSHRRSYARWSHAVKSVLRECEAGGLMAGGDLDALASRFTALVDGLAIQVLTNASPMTVDVMRDLLLGAFEPHLTLRRTPFELSEPCSASE